MELIYHCTMNTIVIDMTDYYERKCTCMTSGFKVLSLQVLFTYSITQLFRIVSL